MAARFGLGILRKQGEQINLSSLKMQNLNAGGHPMAKLRKHQLLEKAMRDYPAGTVARFKSAPNVDHISNGVFSFCDFNNDGKLHIICGVGVNCVYSDGEWAVPVKPSLLSGKCAIAVNNEREKQLVNQYIKGKNPVTADGYSYPIFICLDDSGFYSKAESSKEYGYTIIPFADFAKEVGITVPVFDLYEGDDYGKWKINGDFIKDFKLSSDDAVVNEPVKNKAFSTKEAAEAFVAEQNKPKEIKLQQDSDIPVLVTKNQVRFNCRKLNSRTEDVTLTPDQLAEIYHAYKSLQS